MKRTKYNNIPEQHLLLIRKIAHTSHTIYGWDEDDLFSEACLSYCLVRNKYQAKKKVKKSTFLWISIQRHLQEYLRKQNRMICTLTSIFPTIVDNSTDVITDHIEVRQDNSKIFSIII